MSSEHRFFIAKVAPATAKRLGLNPNHHARVWCACMDDSVSEPGTYAGQHAEVVNERTAEQAANDPRRLGTYDALGVCDLRVPGSGFEIWRKHVEESSRESA